MENLARGRRLRFIAMLAMQLGALMAQQLEISNFSRITIILLNFGYIFLTIREKHVLQRRNFCVVTRGDRLYVVSATLLLIWMLFDDKALLLPDMMVVASHLAYYFLSSPVRYRFDCPVHGMVTLGFDEKHMRFRCPHCHNP